MDLLRQLPTPRTKKGNADGFVSSGDGLGSFKMVGQGNGNGVTTVAVVGGRKSAGPPPYGKRSGWCPRCPDDYGDGGAFPEIHVAQYPLEMGRKKTTHSKTVPLQVDADGRVAWDAVLRQGSAKDKLAVYSRPVVV